MSVGGRGSAHRATVARALGHGKHHALSEALAESTYAGQGKPDFCVKGPRYGKTGLTNWLSGLGTSGRAAGPQLTLAESFAV